MYTDNQLVKRIKKNGDREAANELIKRYYQEIYKFSYRQTTDIHLAMDLTQEIFIAVLKGISSYDNKRAGFRTWLYKIASNKIINYYRSRYYKQSSMETCEENLELLAGTYESEEEILQKIYDEQLIRNVMQTIVNFENEWVQIFQMKLFQDKTFLEIAKELELSENTVKTRYYAMLKELRKEIRK